MTDNIYHKGKISKMSDFDVFSILEFRKRKSRSHGMRKKGNANRKRCAIVKSNSSLNDLSTRLREHDRHAMLSFLSTFAVLRIVEIIKCMTLHF